MRQPTGGGIATAAPTNAYRSADGTWMLIAANSDLLFRKLAALTGRPHLVDDPLFSGNQARCANVAALDRIGGGKMIEQAPPKCGMVGAVSFMSS